MHRTERDILLLFRDEPGLRLSTSRILERLFSSEWKRVQKSLESSSKEEKEEAKLEKARLQRRLLYHLARLEEDKLLSVVDTIARGEKIFALAAQGTIVMGSRHVSIHVPVQQVGNFNVDDNSLFLLHPSSASSRVNAILLDASELPGMGRCDALVREALGAVNDVVAINHFERMIQKAPSHVLPSLKEWDLDAKDYGKRICLLVRVSDIYESASFKKFITDFATLCPRSIRIVFEVVASDISSNHGTFAHIVQEFSKSQVKINLKNHSIHPSPLIVGKAGVYAPDDTVHATIIVDVKKALDLSRNPSDFRARVLKGAKTLLSVARAQRESLSIPGGTYYIRFWNYDWEEEHAQKLSMITSCREDIERFCKDAEIIALSSGMPLQFKIRFSSLVKPLFKELTTRAYKKTPLKSTEDLNSESFQSYLRARESAFQHFDGGDRVRIFRQGFRHPEDVVREMGILLTYALPFITYDFSTMRGTTTLEQFI
ncbi:MAG: hypothetical protein ABIA93_05520 [Candidatus Woesearchaeota archaeon]